MDFEDRYLGFGTYFTDQMKSELYTRELGKDMEGFDAYRYHRSYFEACKKTSPINRMLYVDFKTFMPALNLDTTDRTSMAANLEVRVPYLNKEMLDLASRIPSRLKIKGLKRKFILKKAVESILPKEVIYRKKAGFGAPIRSWLRGPLKPMVNDFLSKENVDRRGLFNHNSIRKIVNDYESGKEDLSLHIFLLVTLELWFRQFID